MSKREREEVERDIFGKGKKVIRSTEQEKREERTKDGDSSFKKTVERESQEMDEIRGLIKEMMKKMNDNMDEIKHEIKLVRKEKKKKWDTERENLMKRIERYGSCGPPIALTCQHSKKTAAYRCKDITMLDQILFHNKFYANYNFKELKTKQDSFILKYTDSFKPQTSKSVNGLKVINHPSSIPPETPVAPLKVRDVSNLVSKHFGNDWKSLNSLSFYRNLTMAECEDDNPLDVYQNNNDESYLIQV
ncbi:hypothetical protein FQA39_LY10271 [Lamprigera yunnana]|nr:hypothetical protein FQA39_LY10271 [Lamprigera yunnana]